MWSAQVPWILTNIYLHFFEVCLKEWFLPSLNFFIFSVICDIVLVFAFLLEEGWITVDDISVKLVDKAVGFINSLTEVATRMEDVDENGEVTIDSGWDTDWVLMNDFDDVNITETCDGSSSFPVTDV